MVSVGWSQRSEGLLWRMPSAKHPTLFKTRYRNIFVLFSSYRRMGFLTKGMRKMSSNQMTGLFFIFGGLVLVLGRFLIDPKKPRKPNLRPAKEQKTRMIVGGISFLLFGTIVIIIN